MALLTLVTMHSCIPHTKLYIVILRATLTILNLYNNRAKPFWRYLTPIIFLLEALILTTV
jgi:hypothetical protein